MKTIISIVVSFFVFASLLSQDYSFLSREISDAEWRLDSTIVSNINVQDIWVPFNKLVNKYDSAGKLYETDNYLWDVTATSWKHFGRSFYLYNDSGERYGSISTSFNDVYNVWDTISQYYESFNENNQLLSWQTFYWNPVTHEWENGGNGTYVRDDKGRVQSFIMNQWDKTNMLWFSSYFYEIKADVYGNDSIGFIYQRFFADDSLRLSYSDIISCDENGNDTLHIEILPDGTPNYKRRYEFIENGIKTRETNYFWENSEWIPFVRIEYIFDSYNNLILTSMLNWDSDTRNWVPGRQENNYYSSLISAADFNPTVHLKIYPNPANDYLIFDLGNPILTAKMTLSDLTGKIILKQSIINQSKISVSGLKRGIYIYQVQNKEETFTGKVLIAK